MSERTDELDRLRRRYASRSTGFANPTARTANTRSSSSSPCRRLLPPGRGPEPTPATRPSRRWWNGSGRAPSCYAASGWPRLGRCGCRTTRATTGRYPPHETPATRSARPRWTGWWPRQGAPTRGPERHPSGHALAPPGPIQGEIWNERRLSFLEADSVAHCGNSRAGSALLPRGDALNSPELVRRAPAETVSTAIPCRRGTSRRKGETRPSRRRSAPGRRSR